MSGLKLLHVYILLCADGSFYTGITNDIERRLLEPARLES
jgi:putative endonuclease